MTYIHFNCSVKKPDNITNMELNFQDVDKSIVDQKDQDSLNENCENDNVDNSCIIENVTNIEKSWFYCQKKNKKHKMRKIHNKKKIFENN